jgi:SAM-dependent methyltransferase
MLDPTRRFSSRVENYLKYRPSYPAAIIPLLEKECGLSQESIIADLGSGTGLLAELFLKYGATVYAVEPNDDMRQAGEGVLAAYAGFHSGHSVNGTAEATTLPNAAVDFITAGQSFHWFDPAKARVEFARILKPGGWVVLIWNGFRVEISPLNRAYQELVVRYGTDYHEVTRELHGRELETFFAPGSHKLAHFNFEQVFDYQGLEGRLLSSSFIPEPGHPNYEPMLKDLRDIFAAHQKNGEVSFAYETEMYYGQLV